MDAHHHCCNSQLSSALLLLLVFLPPFAAAAAPLPPDALALLAFKTTADSDNHLRFHTAAKNSTDSYCWWQGVQCSAVGKVTRLVLEGVGLKGAFADRTLSRLDQLRILSLKNNSLSGPIPDLSLLSNLKALFLDNNAFVGRFPPSILSLHRLRTLDVSNNNLSGPIPAAISTLDRLYYLRLELNHFDGSIPPFNQSTLKIFNVSGNNLSGPVPVTSVLSGFDESAFSDNPELCGEAVRRECRNGYFFKNGPSPDAPSTPVEAMPEMGGQLQGVLLPGPSSPTYIRHKKAAVAFVLAGGAVLAIGLVGVLLAMKKKRKKHRRILSPQKGTAAAAAAADAMEICRENITSDVNSESFNRGSNNGNCGSHELAAAAAMSEEKVKKLGKSGCLVFCAGEASVYTLEQLMRASAELLGRGSVGTTYKAVLDNRLIVSVKRLDAGKMAAKGNEVFERHMETIGRLRHPNLVPLRAYFQAKEERLLVYDYQPNGSLFSLIHGSRSTRAKPLHWTSCLKIAEDVAQGLAYIHQASRLVHGNLKSSNVLLGSDFEACITNNCLAVLVEPSDGEEDSGYRAPEVRNSNRHLTPKSDIYAFGILLLELLTGKPPLPHPFLVATDLPVWVRSVREDEGGEDERLMMILDIAIACVRSSAESRPTTWQVLKMIQEVKEADLEDNDLDSSSIS